MNHRTAFILLLFTLLSASLPAQEGAPAAGRISVRGYGQVYCSATLGRDAPAQCTFDINKAEVLATGRITNKWSAGITVQLNKPVLLKDLYMQYEVLPALKIRMGQFKTPFGLENQLAPFLNPLARGGSMPTVCFAGIALDPLYSGTAGRDIGIEIAGDLWHKRISYRIAAMNGRGMNARSIGIGKMLGASLHIRPAAGLTLHASYTGGRHHAMAPAKGLQAGDEYTRHRLSAGIAARYAPLSVSAEYMYGSDHGIPARGAYVTSAIHLPGRIDLVLAGDWLDADAQRPGHLLTATAGVQRWFYKRCRWQAEYRYAAPIGGSSMMGGKKRHELLAQLQFVF